MDVCEDLARGIAWQAGARPSANLALRAPAARYRYPRQSRAIGLAERGFVPAAWLLIRVGLALVPWSALAWLFIAD